jgi:hypothetical protein
MLSVQRQRPKTAPESPESAAVEVQTALIRVIADRDQHRCTGVLHHTGSVTMAIDLVAGATVLVASPNYGAFAERSVGSVLDISLTQLVFAGEGGNCSDIQAAPE